MRLWPGIHTSLLRFTSVSKDLKKGVTVFPSHGLQSCVCVVHAVVAEASLLYSPKRRGQHYSEKMLIFCLQACVGLTQQDERCCLSLIFFLCSAESDNPQQLARPLFFILFSQRGLLPVPWCSGNVTVEMIQPMDSLSQQVLLCGLIERVCFHVFINTSLRRDGLAFNPSFAGQTSDGGL